MRVKYFIKTFGCQQNKADSERIASMLKSRGMSQALDIEEADHVVINTCMVRESAENRVYGLVYNLGKKRQKTGLPQKIVITGCIVGMAARDKSGKFQRLLKKRMPYADEFLPIEEVGFDHAPLRSEEKHAWVPISNGCNNFCTFCVVPFTRGREASRPYADVIEEIKNLVDGGYSKVTLLGMNVNSYGADLVLGKDNIQVMRDLSKKYFDNKSKKAKPERGVPKAYKLPNGRQVKPVLVKHLGRLRIPTLFPYLLEEVANISGLEHIDFISSNPWDFSDELINVVAQYKNITKKIHLPVQSGSNTVLKRMNRWYRKEQYLALISKLKSQISRLKISTDIIVGFCEETDEEFQETVDLAKKVGFYKAYIAMYSDRPQTAAHKALKDNVPYKEKKKRWEILENLINKPNLELNSYRKHKLSKLK